VQQDSTYARQHLRLTRPCPFTSRCPKCGYQWLQDGYTRRALLELLNSECSIEAYCMRCAVLWPISLGEQHAPREALAK